MSTVIPIYDIQNFSSYKKDGILVSRIGNYVQQHQHLQRAHRHSFYHLVLFTHGSGQQQIDFKNFEVWPNLIYFMVPGQVHSWNFTSKPDGYVINFSTSYFSGLLLNPTYLQQFTFFDGNPDQQVIHLQPEFCEKISQIFEEILSEGELNVVQNDDFVKLTLLRLFTEIARVSTSQQKTIGNSYNYRLIKNFTTLIDENFATLKLPKQYAALLYVTPNHLNAVCNDLLGISAGKLIRDRIILEAKRLLINVDLRVNEIAEKLNFQDQSYFVKFFKRYENITPDKFRKQYTTT